MYIYKKKKKSKEEKESEKKRIVHNTMHGTSIIGHKMRVSIIRERAKKEKNQYRSKP